MQYARLVTLASCALGSGAKQLWATEPADPDNIIMTAYPIGNGKIGGRCTGFSRLKLLFFLDTDGYHSAPFGTGWAGYCGAE
jgi:alpha-L-fucosidase 2